ncbi:MAG: Rrf2 family transcriptional regulator [Candidatus Hydrogenedentes bacterium]|nr:Rrf2 family transcriptional regulator [Candidatus Hydrogenedentota bacterium]
MQLTQYSDYAFRTLIYLAISTENATITEIAEHYQISRNHLVKVVHNLGKLGYITTTRGRQGGLRLAMPPEQINIGEVVRKTEPNFNLVECFDREKNQCVITPACKLMGILGEAFQAFTDVLDQYTLADMTTNRDDLRDCLGLSTRIP